MMDCSASSHGYIHCSPEDQIPIIHLFCSWTGHTNDACHGIPMQGEEYVVKWSNHNVFTSALQ